MGENKDIQKKLDAQRKALEEHQRKEQEYKHQQDKDFARKTQERIQKEIADLEKRKNKR